MGVFRVDVGYAEQVETKPGVWVDVFTERNYRADLVRNTSRIRDGENLNDDLTIDNRISILADAYAYSKFHTMRYVRWMEVLWKVISVEVQRPRLLLTIGGVYNGQTFETS